MKLYYAISVVVPLVLFLGLPKLLAIYTKHERLVRWRLVTACLLFSISWYLPSPLIDGQDTSFVTHFIGGGIFTAFLWWYIEGSLRLNWPWYTRIIMVYALVSSLGNINELFELFLVRTHLATILITDTSWDILANTVGALATYGVILAVRPHDSWHR